MQVTKGRKRLFIIIGSVIILALVAVFVLPAISGDRSQAAQDLETAEAFVGDLSASATASGQVLPRRQATLSANQPGRVDALFVRVGDRVQAGDTLVQLATTELDWNVATAEQNLRLAEAKLQELLGGSKESDLIAAQAAVISAQAELDDLLAGPDAEEIAAREADLKAAQANLQSSSAQLNQTENTIKNADLAAAEAAVASAEANLKSVEIQYTRNPDPDDIQANTALAQAREQLASAQARLDTLQSGPDQNQVGSAQASLAASSAQRDAAEAQLNKLAAGPSTAQVAAAKAQVAQAEASYADLLEGATDEQITAAEAEVEQARVNLEDAKATLEEATLKAPFAGVITAVNFEEGELASGPVIRLVDETSLEVILQVDEVDVGNLQVGQPATVTLEAWPEVELPTAIRSIAPSSTTIPGSSLVTYEVHLDLGDTGLPVLSGMTADANLITAEKEDVLLVPNQAVRVDRTNGTYSVILVVGDTTQEVPVSIGLRDNDYTQITAGLEAGDQVLISINVPLVTPGSGNGSSFGQND